jgi:hypothetical protein
MFGFIVFCILLVAAWKVGGNLYRRWYWWDRKQRIQTQIKFGLMDGQVTREAIDEMRERGEL